MANVLYNFYPWYLVNILVMGASRPPLHARLSTRKLHWLNTLLGFPSLRRLPSPQVSDIAVHQKGTPNPRSLRKSSWETPNPAGDGYSVLRLSGAISPRPSKSTRSCKFDPITSLCRCLTERVFSPCTFSSYRSTYHKTKGDASYQKSDECDDGFDSP